MEEWHGARQAELEMQEVFAVEYEKRRLFPMWKGKEVKFLIDTSPAKMTDLAQRPLVGGQLLTPLTRYSDWGGQYAIDNGAFSGFDRKAFDSLLERQKLHKPRCLFVTIPDIVGNHKRTWEIWRYRQSWKFAEGWPHAFVMQNGAEDADHQWPCYDAIFIGGTDPWKDSKAVIDLVKTAKVFGVHVHVGRVNTVKRYRLFAEAGADTCDGSGIAMYDHMLRNIERELAGENKHPELFGNDEEAA